MKGKEKEEGSTDLNESPMDGLKVFVLALLWPRQARLCHCLCVLSNRNSKNEKKLTWKQCYKYKKQVPGS